MFCQHCGKEIPEGATFCSFCGEKQLVIADKSIEKNKQASNSIYDKRPDPRKKTIILFAIGSVVAVGIIIAALIKSMSGTSSPTSFLEEDTTNSVANNAEEEVVPFNVEYYNEISDWLDNVENEYNTFSVEMKEDSDVDAWNTVKEEIEYYIDYYRNVISVYTTSETPYDSNWWDEVKKNMGDRMSLLTEMSAISYNEYPYDKDENGNIEYVENAVTESKSDIEWQIAEQIFEDKDGYKIKRKLKISPFISYDNTDALTSAIEELGGNIDDLPTIEYGNVLLNCWKQNEINEALYVMGEISLENVTQGFDISSDNTHKVIMYIVLAPDEGYVPLQGEILCEQLENDNSNLGWEITRVFFDETLQKVGHGGYEANIRIERNDYDSSIANIYLGHAKMNSNNWGPVRFVMMFPNKHTPALPDGFGIYKNMECIFGDTSLKLNVIE